MSTTWFSADGRNTDGYDQIEARLKFLRKNKDISPNDRRYELNVVYSIFSEIPAESSRQDQGRRIMRVLEELGLLEEWALAMVGSMDTGTT